MLESFAHGLPCIMSEVAAEGLELPDDLAWLVARSQREFVEKLARTHEDEALNQSLSEAGLAYIEQRYSANAVKEALLAAVAGNRSHSPLPMAGGHGRGSRSPASRGTAGVARQAR